MRAHTVQCFLIYLRGTINQVTSVKIPYLNQHRMYGQSCLFWIVYYRNFQKIPLDSVQQKYFYKNTLNRLTNPNATVCDLQVHFQIQTWDFSSSWGFQEVIKTMQWEGILHVSNFMVPLIHINFKQAYAVTKLSKLCIIITRM